MVGPLRILDGAGIGVGLDDLGTADGSLTNLRRLPIEFVKLDRSVVAGLASHPEDRAMASALIQLADGLGLVVVAEGVETSEQAAELATLGATRAQGYFFGRPEPI